MGTLLITDSHKSTIQWKIMKSYFYLDFVGMHVISLLTSFSGSTPSSSIRSSTWILSGDGGPDASPFALSGSLTGKWCVQITGPELSIPKVALSLCIWRQHLRVIVARKLSAPFGCERSGVGIVVYCFAVLHQRYKNTSSWKLFKPAVVPNYIYFRFTLALNFIVCVCSLIFNFGTDITLPDAVVGNNNEVAFLIYFSNIDSVGHTLGQPDFICLHIFNLKICILVEPTLKLICSFKCEADTFTSL